MGKVLEFTLPLPPSVNHYYVRTRRGVTISHEGLVYRQKAKNLVRVHGFRVEGRLGVTVTAFMDKRRDLDNLCKCLLDSLQKAKMYDNDNQIDDLHLLRGGKGDGLIVEVRELGPTTRTPHVDETDPVKRLRLMEAAAKILLDSGDRLPLVSLMEGL